MGAAPTTAGDARAGRTAGPELYDEARRLVARGDKIQAVKIYRAATGLGLKEAKDFVDDL